MRLFIAEKPSLGRAIAEGLGGGKESKGHIRIGRDVVTWCFGHILEQAEPEDYDEKYAKWNIEDLPIYPTKWKLKVKKEAKDQFKLIKSLVQEASEIVNAGDPDREGQLLVDEVLNELNVFNDPAKKVTRILLNALDEKSVRAALQRIEDNKKFTGLRNSALARSRADWLIGMNLTRIYTIRARGAGFQNVVSIGRVQTPTMALVVRRELEIKNFTPVTFYTPMIQFHHERGDFIAKWKKREGDGIDEEGRIVDRDVADSILAKAANSLAKIAKVEQKKGQSLQRLPYSLSALQIDAGKLFGYSPQEVLDVQQSLYEKKLTSYPRSDCDFLPENQIDDRDVILSNLAHAGEDFSDFAKKADRSIKSRAWNDKKISAHHAIIPTTVKPDFSKLDEKERNMYALIAKAYIAQFYESEEFLSTTIEVETGKEFFSVHGKVVLRDGWKSIYKKMMPLDEEGEEKNNDEDKQTLPNVSEGDSAIYIEGKVKEGITKPPSRYTPTTLLAAMKHIDKYVKDKELAKVLKDCSGLGTEATRAGILETIQKRGFVATEKKNIVPTELSMTLFKILPETLTYPDTTARWEDMLDAISRREMDVKVFMDEQERLIQEFIREGKTISIEPPKNLARCPACDKPLVRRKGKDGFFWGCTGYPDCKTTFPDKRGKPDFDGKKKTSASAKPKWKFGSKR